MVFTSDLQRPHRFAVVYCSQCGRECGSGNHGYSHCEDHYRDARLRSFRKAKHIPDRSEAVDG